MDGQQVNKADDATAVLSLSPSFNDSCLATDTQLEIILGCNGFNKVLVSQARQGGTVLVVRIIHRIW